MKRFNEKHFDNQLLSKNGEKVSKWGFDWQASQKFRHDLALNIIKPLLSKKENLRILDIGCADGVFTNKIIELGKNHNIIGIDISEKFVAYCNEKYACERVNFEKGVLPQLKFKDGQFDLVICLDVIPYLSKKERLQALREIKRVLCSKGYALLSEWLTGDVVLKEGELLREIKTEFIVKRTIINYSGLYYKYVRKRLLPYCENNYILLERKLKLKYFAGWISYYILKNEFLMKTFFKINKQFCKDDITHKFYLVRR